MRAVTIMRGVGATTVLVIALGMTSGGRAAHGTPDPCFPPHTHTYVLTGRVRVWTPRTRNHYTLVACDRRTKFVTTVENGVGATAIFPPPAIDVQGLVVGYASDYKDDIFDPSDTEVNAVRLDGSPTGKRLPTSGTLPPVPNTGAPGVVLVGSLRVRSDGNVAWIQCPSHQDDPVYATGNPRPNCVKAGLSINRVYVEDAGDTRRRLLAKGRNIDPTSLRLYGTKLTWNQGGRVRSGSFR